MTRADEPAVSRAVHIQKPVMHDGIGGLSEALEKEGGFIPRSLPAG